MEIRPYVYLVLVDGITRYVGKGSGNRKDFHIKVAKKLNVRRAGGEKVKSTNFYNKLAKALREGACVTTKVLRYYSTEEEAFEAEVRAIAKRVGLWNVLGGGNGFTSESSRVFWRKERKKRLAAVRAGGRKRWAKIEERERQSSLAKRVMQKSREDPNFIEKIKQATQERYRKSGEREKAAGCLRATVIKLWQTADFRELRSVSQKIVARKLWNSPVYREKHAHSMKVAVKKREASSTYREKRAAGIRAKWADPEFRARRSREIAEANRKRKKVA